MLFFLHHFFFVLASILTFLWDHFIAMFWERTLSKIKINCMRNLLISFESCHARFGHGYFTFYARQYGWLTHSAKSRVQKPSKISDWSIHCIIMIATALIQQAIAAVTSDIHLLISFFVLFFCCVFSPSRLQFSVRSPKHVSDSKLSSPLHTIQMNANTMPNS